MKRRKLHVIWLWGLLFLMTACGDDDYYYPSVKLEFVTVEAGEDGRIQTLIPDKGEAFACGGRPYGFYYCRKYLQTCNE